MYLLNLRSHPEAGEKFWAGKGPENTLRKIELDFMFITVLEHQTAGSGSLFFAHVTCGGGIVRCAGSAGHVQFSCLFLAGSFEPMTTFSRGSWKEPGT